MSLKDDLDATNDPLVQHRLISAAVATAQAAAVAGENDVGIAVASLTGTLTGTANGAMVDVAATAGSCAGGATPTAGQVDTAIATAVASIVLGVNEQNKEVLTKLNALLSSLRTAGIIAT